MDYFLYLVILVVLSLVMSLILKSFHPSFAFVTCLVTIIGLCIYSFTTLSSVLSVLGSLEELSGLSNDVLEPVLKTALIGILTNMTAAICVDSGQSGMGKMVEVCGSALTLYLSMPLISAVLDMLTTMIGG